MKCTVCGGSGIEEFEHGLISRQCIHCKGTGEEPVSRVEPDNQPIGSSDTSKPTEPKKRKVKARASKKAR